MVIRHWSLIWICVLIFISHAVVAQSNKKYIGVYKNEIGEKIEFCSDSTYSYSRRVHMEYRWSSGKWSVKNDTIFLKLIAASDTVMALDLNKHYKFYPSKLFFSKQRVYNVADGGIILKGKISSGFSRKKFSVVYKKL